jgi:hypothetical protein
VQGTQDPIEPNNIRDTEFAFRNASGYDDTGVDTSKAARGCWTVDNSYYHANLQNNVLFRSDWELHNDTTVSWTRSRRTPTSGTCVRVISNVSRTESNDSICFPSHVT